VLSGHHQGRRVHFRPCPRSSPRAVCGARRTPGPHVAPTDRTRSTATDGVADRRSYCAGASDRRSQFVANSSRDCVFIATAGRRLADGTAGALRLYAGASSTSLCTLSGCCAA